MYRGFKLRNHKITKLQNRSCGYILITMMLFLSLLAMAALAVLPDIALQVKRDREEELIHRGLGYSRGIRRFYKKFGRYPTKIEDLENTNTLRFIRKRYKDPVTGEDFKILRVGDPALASLMTGQVQGLGLQGQIGGQGALGGVQSRGGLGSNSTLTGQQTQVTNTDATNAAAGGVGNSSSSASSSSSTGDTSSSSDTSSSTQQVFGGGPMLGVVSTNKGKTIREFCKKNHYKDWLFIYDPTSDRGGALNTPWCPGIFNQGPGVNPAQPVGSPSPPNTGAPGTVAPTQNQTNPGSQMPPEQ